MASEGGPWMVAHMGESRKPEIAGFPLIVSVENLKYATRLYTKVFFSGLGRGFYGAHPWLLSSIKRASFQTIHNLISELLANESYNSTTVVA